jgi:hypothetical protein
MLSQDKSTIKICKKKLASKFDGEKDEETWNALCDVLLLEETTAEVTADCYDAPAVVQQLWKLLEEETESSTTSLYVLLTLRLIVLHPKQLLGGTTAIVPTSSVQYVLQGFSSKDGSWKTPTARSMAWCMLSNAVATVAADKTYTLFDDDNDNQSLLHSFIDAAMMDLVVTGDAQQQQQPVQVRQMASTFLYNVVLMQQKQRGGDDGSLNDALVSMLCSNLDGSIVDETDSTTRLRRLLVVGKILTTMTCYDKNEKGSTTTTLPSMMNEMARNLADDLGFADTTLRPLLAQQPMKNQKDPTERECHDIVLELSSMLT